MIILPAIDLKDGKCVRLQKGDFSTTHKVAENPLHTAGVFAGAGAKFIHIVDLDGALEGVRKNAGIVREIAEGVDVKIQLGGGMRTMADLESADKMGVYRMVIGSAAVGNPSFVREAVKRYGERIAVGIDAKNGRVRTHGWVEDSGISAVQFAVEMENLGVETIIYTDIETDGMLTGSPITALEELRNTLDCRIIASGGVSGHEDLNRLKSIGMDGAIIGKAYYSGAIDLERAVKEAGEQCWQKG